VVKLYDRNKTLAFVLTFYKLGEELGYADMSCSKLSQPERMSRDIDMNKSLKL
jgi:hypothetical protein